MKVRFFSDYTNSEVLLNRFKANYIIDDHELDFTTANDYDFAVVFNRANEPIIPGVKIITVIQEPSFSEAHQYRTFLAYSDYLLIHDPGLFERTWNIKLSGTVIETPAYMFYDDKIDHSFFEEKEAVKKSRKLSMIVSSLYLTRGNYLKRLQLLDKILQSDLDIDIYGRGFTIPDPRYKGQLEFKYTGLLPYEYSIAIENSNEKNYISEKFVDCVLCNTIPIYNGAPNVSDVYDDRYLRKIDLDSPSVVEDIKAIIAQPAPPSTVNKEIYFKKYNLYTKLKEIIFEIDPKN
ncbi:glycosyltransferase family 10 domain-containing protein [Pedobacter sp. L105]|uniref:glycosyltransferase family 10 domain-containing protein n=1 Tax=Pedobacter sp. L105 TaxID=1641871 RepID=UPI00131E334F|nr:glycosyltransferase family 10 [Pedobacter sp. L105]